MIYLLAIFVSPLALLLYGKILQALFNLFLYVGAVVLVVTILLSWAGFGLWALGVLHAVLVINNDRAERRNRALLDAVKTGQPK